MTLVRLIPFLAKHAYRFKIELCPHQLIREKAMAVR